MTCSPPETASSWPRRACSSGDCSRPVFCAAPASGVVDALRGYQNADGGFGQALEPDTRCPASLPVYVETALQALATAATVDRAMVLRACDFLARTANEAGTGGAVPLAFPVIESFPRAGHWTEWTYEPGLNPTAGLAGLLYQLGVEHSWRTDATRYCWERLESGSMPGDAHALSEALVFLEHVPARNAADTCVAAIAPRLGEVAGLHLDPGTPGYGLSPLHFAPTRRLEMAPAVHRCPDRCRPRPSPGQPGAGRRMAHQLGAAQRGRPVGMEGDRDAAGPADPHLLRARRGELIAARSGVSAPTCQLLAVARRGRTRGPARTDGKTEMPPAAAQLSVGSRLYAGRDRPARRALRPSPPGHTIVTRLRIPPRECTGVRCCNGSHERGIRI